MQKIKAMVELTLSEEVYNQIKEEVKKELKEENLKLKGDILEDDNKNNRECKIEDGFRSDIPYSLEELEDAKDLMDIDPFRQTIDLFSSFYDVQEHIKKEIKEEMNDSKKLTLIIDFLKDLDVDMYLYTLRNTIDYAIYKAKEKGIKQTEYRQLLAIKQILDI